MSMNN